MRRTQWLGWIGTVLVALVGCDRGAEDAIAPEPPAAEEPAPAAADEAPAAAEAEPAAAPAAPAEEAAEVGPTAAGDGYEVQATLVGPYAAGEPATFALALEARDEWHLNEDFPTQIDVSGPAAVAFPKASLAKADAAEFGEMTARFDVPFRVTEAGEYPVEAKVSFAICTPETCIPTERTVALRLPVE